MSGADQVISASPSAKRLADENNLNIAAVAGTGKDGRVLKEDVQNALKGGAAAPAPSSHRIFVSPYARKLAGDQNIALEGIIGTGPGGRIIGADILALEGKSPVAAGEGPYEEIRLNAMRKTIARRMTEAKQEVPHFYLTVDINIDRLLSLRSDYNGLERGPKVSLNDFIIRATAIALGELPAVNVQFGGDHIKQFSQADIAVAVALDGGLITPIVRDAGNKDVAAIAADMVDLAERARGGKLMPEEYQGGTISISNLGMYGIREFAAVINPPQGSILAIGAGEQRAVVIDDEIVKATMMTVTMACDHRAMDGAIGAQFLGILKEIIEHPLQLLV